MAKVSIHVNHNKCVGSQLCMMFSPDVFDINENGQSIVIDADAQDANSIISTAEQCPQCAITVTDNETGDILFPPEGLSF